MSKWLGDRYATTLQILRDSGQEVEARYYDAVIEQERTHVINQAIEVVRNRVDEFGVGQEYQNYFTQTLGGSLSSANDLEIGIALDQSRSDVFAMPVREDFQVWNDPNLHRQNLIGFYGHGEYGYSVTDNRRTLLCSL